MNLAIDGGGVTYTICGVGAAALEQAASTDAVTNASAAIRFMDASYHCGVAVQLSS